MKSRTPLSVSRRKKDFKRSTYVDTLDSVFSHYVRQKYADENGNVRCFTCDKVMPWKEIQNGHYGGKFRSTRGSYATRWHEDGSRPQDYGCNVGQWGKQAVYHERLVEDIGEDRIDALMQLSHTTVKLSNIDLLEMIREYYAKLRWPEQISKTLQTNLKKLKVV